MGIIRGEPERAPNTRDTGSGFICIIFVCLWGDYFHNQRVKLRIANVGNGRQTRVHLESTKISAETGKVNRLS